MTAALLRCSSLGLVVVALGCGTRALDPESGTGGTIAIDGGAGSDGAADALFDVRSDVRDVRVLEIIEGAMCGDGIVDRGEQCDDNNKSSGDGCSAICQIECFASCGACGTPGPCIVVPVCGNGVLDPREVCEDGNTASGDGCAGDCTTIAPGWACPVIGRRCVPICGDGIVVGPETCDDRNQTPGDGCSDVCVVEPSTTRCGDGIISGAEECDEGAANSDAFQSRCTTSCRFGAFCGNGVVDVGEECDNGSLRNNVTYGNQDGCAAGCKYPHFCGDAIVDVEYGEQCDLGPSNGMPSWYCSLDCKIPL